MGIIIASLFRFGVLATAVGVLVGLNMKTLPSNTLALILLALVAAYLLWSIFTANRPTSYSGPSQCFRDLMGDICAYTLTFGALVLWLVAPRYHLLPPNPPHYNLIALFLGGMTFVTLVEMAVSIRTGLIAMYRENPISLR